MAAHTLTIAKASLSAGLLRPDPTSIQRDEIARLHSLLDAALLKGSSVDIQLCKTWLLENIVPSVARITALGKYLTVLSNSFQQDVDHEDQTRERSRRGIAQKKQIHILYLLNDLLHHTKYHSKNSSSYSVLTGTLQGHLVDLFGSAAAYDPALHKQHAEIETLLSIWNENGYYQSGYVQKLRETVQHAASQVRQPTDGGSMFGVQQSGTTAKELRRDAPFVMPATHGDSSAPYYELPAGNMMPQIVPNSTDPISVHLMRPLQFVAGPADEGLVQAVKQLLSDVDALYRGGRRFEEISNFDVDDLGQPICRNEITGEIQGREGYYGWSKSFCQKMKRRRRGGEKDGSEDAKIANEDPFDNRGRYKRRRSYSSDSGRSGSDVSSGTRSRSRSRPGTRRNKAHRRTRSSSEGRSRSPGARFQGPRMQWKSSSRSRSHTPHREHHGEHQPIQQPRPRPPPPPPPPSRNNGDLPIPPFLPEFAGLGPEGVPVPPPPPPNYRGPWPPPPPPLGLNVSGGPGGIPFPAFPNFIPPPPPPPPFPGPYGGNAFPPPRGASNPDPMYNGQYSQRNGSGPR